MTDSHSHALPGVDDGSRSAEESAAILKSLLQVGINRLALTPHFYPIKNTVAHFLAAREKAFQELIALPEASSFVFAKGAEVYFTESLFKFADMKDLCFEGTNLMMVEPAEREELNRALTGRLERLMSYDVVPVIAHIDRFPYLIYSRRTLEELRDMGCLFQINLSSAFEWKTRGACVRLLKRGMIDFLGNDLHRPIPDPELYTRQLEKLKKKTGEEPFSYVERFASPLFGLAPEQTRMAPLPGEDGGDSR